MRYFLKLQYLFLLIKLIIHLASTDTILVISVCAILTMTQKGHCSQNLLKQSVLECNNITTGN